MRLRLPLRTTRRLLSGSGAAFFVCDQQERVIDAGKGSFELTGLKDEDVIGRPVREVLGLEWIDQGDGDESADTDGDGVTDPIETSLEWGVRSLGKRVSVNAEGDLPAEAVADVFPAYDDDGGLLLVLTPGGLGSMGSTAPEPLRPALRARAWSSPRRSSSRPRRRSSASTSRAASSWSSRASRPAPRPIGQRPGHRPSRSRSSESGPTRSASPSPKSRGSAPTPSASACPTSPTPNRAAEQVGTTAQLYFYDWEPNLIGPEQAIGGHPGAASRRKRR